MKILVVEDERLIADQLVTQLEEIGYKSIGVATNSKTAIDLFKDLQPDFLIIDIGLKNSELDGIETSIKLQSLKPTPCIFLSGFSDQKTLNRVKAVTHSNYLIKPCSVRQLYVSIDTAIDRFTKENNKEKQIANFYNSEQNNHFYVKGTQGAYDRVNVSELMWIETVRGGIELHLESAKQYMLTASLNSFLLQFQHPDLLRVHRSFLVNKSKVSAIKDKTFILKSTSKSKSIPCSQSYWTEVKGLFKTLRSD